ncbi:hypothetical protein JCM33374_g2239 [Metschnikowia sp. JCM 33374]|nr:hypothetical protein JCM33374_g2239 [Metschnikowia sp. JCM 33374]
MTAHLYIYTAVLFSWVTSAISIETPEKAISNLRFLRLVLSTDPSPGYNDIAPYGGQSIHKRQSELLPSPTSEIEQSIDWFFTCLKFYVFQTHFDWPNFELVAPDLKQDLAYLEILISETNQNFEAIARVQFAKRILETMIFAAQKMNHFNYSRVPEEHLLIRMTELNVRIFSLFNSRGQVDIKVPGYTEKTIGLWKEMCLLAHEFSEQDFPENIRVLFEFQRLQAEASIYELWKSCL